MLRRYLLWPAAALGSILFLLVAVIVLRPAVARAQFVANSGATVAEVLAALVGQPIAASTYAATTLTGSGHTCTAALAACFDPGPGTCNEYGTNGSGEIILGGTDCNPTIRWGDSSVISGSSWTNVNGAINCEGACVIRNNAGPLRVPDTVLMGPQTLLTCDATIEWAVAMDATSGGTTGARSRGCMCTSNGAGTPAYAWQNLATGTVGTSTTCTP